MQEFALNEDQEMLRSTVRDFVNSEIKPIAAKIDEDEKIPRELIDKILGDDLSVGAFINNLQEDEILNLFN